MEQGLKQRLVGALVLFSLAAIFLPLVFDGRSEGDLPAIDTIPDEPFIQITRQTENKAMRQQLDDVKRQIALDRQKKEQPDDVSNSGVANTIDPVAATRVTLKDEAAEDKRISQQPLTSSTPLADAWTVQLGAFKSKSNALGLKSKLIKRSYHAYLTENTAKGKTVYRVYVGPEIRKNRAVDIQQALKKEFKLDGIVKPYKPY